MTLKHSLYFCVSWNLLSPVSQGEKSFIYIFTLFKNICSLYIIIYKYSIYYFYYYYTYSIIILIIIKNILINDNNISIKLNKYNYF